MARILQYLPELTGHEQLHVARLITPMSDEQVLQFASAYRMRRRDPQHVLLLALLGFLGVAGVHRLLTGDIGWGIVFLLTGGLCGIGTIVDLVRHREIADRYNLQQADETALYVRSLGAAAAPPLLPG